MTKISKIFGTEVIDSRGNPTVEATVITTNNTIASAIVPSGASTGVHEAVELRDKDKNRYFGKGVLKAIKNIDEVINKSLVGMDVFSQRKIDETLIELDGTKNKSNLGANSILAASMACIRCASKEAKMPLFRYIGGNMANTLPVPMMNILNGGAHADNGIDFQEFMIFPIKAETFSHSLLMGTKVFHNLKKILSDNGLSTNVGDEGGFAPNISSNKEAIELVIKAIEISGYKPGEDILIAIDAAASEFYDKENNLYTLNNGKNTHTTESLINVWENWINKYPIVSIEDGLFEDDWDGWKKMSDKIGNKVQLVGDDLFVTNIERLSKGIDNKVANAVLIKVNQIGSISETSETIKLAKLNNYNCVMSHRSGETEDTTIADLSVAFDTLQIKTGSVCRTDRVAKYNRLLRIEKYLGSSAKFAGQYISF